MSTAPTPAQIGPGSDGPEREGAPPPPDAAELRARLATVMTSDAARLGRRIERTSRSAEPRRTQELRRLAVDVAGAQERLLRRAAALPLISYPPELPVSARVDDLAAAIAEHQVVIVAGETGSGKSTQLPKICLELGRGVRGMIGHTQPRRIAARALAERVSEELGTDLGRTVGYSIRFGDHTGPDTLVKLMTDGILLAEIHRDRMLSAYDTIILDEAHERSLNIDFLLGYLVQLLPRRPDLKLIITSATIDPDRFARHFATPDRPVPVIEVSGRTYPVEIRYRPVGVDETDDDGDGDGDGAGDGRASARAPEGVDAAQAICAAVDELTAAGDGDILVFLSGEREITDTADVLRGHLAGRPGRTEVLPLYGRLSAADQHRVFDAHAHRRIVLATNVAETSLTVPGIRYVIDPGTARISRYAPRTKVQRLPIEKVSQASAGQRAGRCGRVADGICIRLYSEADFRARDEFTDPEIARTALAAVILQMAALELGDIASFPFLDPPDRRQITDGVTVLAELGALDRDGDAHRLTPIGRQLAALPVDVRLARMIVEGQRRGVLPEMLVLAAALAIQDVRERPLEDREKAAAAHARFADARSDFLGTLHLWVFLTRQAGELSGNAFRRMCRREYLHYLRIREWQDLHAQLAQICRGLGWDTTGRIGAQVSAPASETPAEEQGPGSTAPAEQQGRGSTAVAGLDVRSIHTAVLAGLLSHIGARLEAPPRTGRDARAARPLEQYQGTRGTQFALWPSAAPSRAKPALVVAAELVETSRLWGRTVASVDPAWVEDVGGDLLRRSHSEPRWEKRRGAVVATEKLTLLGVTLVAARTVQFDLIDPDLARELFLRHALVEGDWETRLPFLAANQQTLRLVEEQGEKVRRRDIAVDDDTLFALYDAVVPAAITSGRALEAWWRRASAGERAALVFGVDRLTAAQAAVDPEQFPDTFTVGAARLPLEYVFEPGRADDGVTVTIPLAVLARVDPTAFQAQIPGLRKDLVVALLKSLPKTLRRNFVPAPDFADAALARMPATPVALERDLAAALTSLTGIRVTEGDFDAAKVPDHLLMSFRVVDDGGREVAEGKDLPALRDALRADSRRAVAKAAGGVERTGLIAFPAEGVPRSVRSTVAGQEVVGHPALVDEGARVGVRVFTSVGDQDRAMRAGTRRLVVLAAQAAGAVSASRVRQSLGRPALLALAASPHGDFAALVDDATGAAVDALLDWAGGPAWTADRFTQLTSRLLPELPRAVDEVMAAAAAVLTQAHRAGAAIDTAAARSGSLLYAPAVRQLRGQLGAHLRPGFLTRTGAAHLPDLTRYLQGIAVRAERLPDNPERDTARAHEIDDLQFEFDEVVAGLRPERRGDPDVQAAARLLDELRVATFAQPLRTAGPVSPKRVLTAIATLSGRD